MVWLDLLDPDQEGEFDIDGLIRHWDRNADLAASGVEFLTYGFLDVIAGGHYEAAQALSGQVDTLENDLFESASGLDVRRSGFELRRRTQSLRRLVAPMHDVISRLGGFVSSISVMIVLAVALYIYLRRRGWL